MNLIDSSFWLEFYGGTKNADYVSEKIQNMSQIIIPTIIIVEVFKKLLIVAGEKDAIKFIAQMKKGNIVELNFEISLNSALYGIKYQLPIADSIIYATAIANNAQIYTLDKHFKDLPNVIFYEK